MPGSPRSVPVIPWLLLLLSWCGAAACQPPRLNDESSRLPAADDPTLSKILGARQVERLAALAAEADGDPDDLGARRASGFAHMWATLEGAYALQARAELDLEAAFALDPSYAPLSRALGRFYNMRAVAGDASKAQRQVEVYAAYLGTTAPDAMNSVQFVAWSFSRLGVILAAKNRGRLLAALAEVEALEAALERRTQRRPDDVELHALAGNFAFFFAGNLPTGKRRRVNTAVRHFEVVAARWDSLRRGARHPDHCPNTRENFLFELAEGYLVLGRLDDARDLYRELSTVRQPATSAKRQIARVSEQRLAHAERYTGQMRLMPPWPSDVSNCVVCHTHTADIATHSLYVARAARGR